MPFHGVLPHRQHMFQPQPRTDIGVNDANAWRLNTMHRHVYDKLHIALAQGLSTAPCGVRPVDMGIDDDRPLFIKPITNLSGMALGTRKTTAAKLNAGEDNLPGHFWCEFLTGAQSSTDCLLHNGKVVWFAHTRASDEKRDNRPIRWHIGVDLPEQEPRIAAFLEKQLTGYTGLCNLEMIGDYIIEVHLRGSNTFFDYYGAAFIPAWVKLVDDNEWHDPGKIPGGIFHSKFD